MIEPTILIPVFAVLLFFGGALGLYWVGAWAIGKLVTSEPASESERANQRRVLEEFNKDVDFNTQQALHGADPDAFPPPIRRL